MQRKGLTLIEILIAVILISISLAALAIAVSTGKYFIQRAQNDSQALSLAIAHKESLLSHSYSHPDLCDGCTDSGTEDTIFDWTTTVTEDSMCTGGGLCVPYKVIDSIVEYPEETISGATSGITKRIGVRDILPYPKVHIEDINTGASACTSGVDADCEVTIAWRVVGDDDVNASGVKEQTLEIDLPAYPMTKDLLIIYDIAIKIEDVGLGATQLQSGDLILSMVQTNANDGTPWVSRNPPIGTPILSQASIGNILSVANIAANKAHTVRVIWRKDHAHGTVSIEKANLIVTAFESD